MIMEQKLYTYVKLIYDKLSSKVIGCPIWVERQDIITSIKMSELRTTFNNVYKFISLTFNSTSYVHYTVNFFIKELVNYITFTTDSKEYVTCYILEILKSEHIKYKVEDDFIIMY